MGFLTPNDIQGLHSLYFLQLRYLLSTEKQILKGLGSMIKHASDPQLKQAFELHREETESHAQRLVTLISDVNDGDVDDKKDPIIAALIGSGDNIVSESDEGPIRDAGLLATAQKIEHYEIASYGTARDWAYVLGLPEHASLLQRTLDEEKSADRLLSAISGRANVEAEAA